TEEVETEEVEEEVQETEEVETEEVETEEVEEKDKVKPETSGEPKEEPEKKEKEEDEEDPMAKTFDEIAEALEIEELMFLEEDKEYEASPDGFKAMLKDNMSAYQKKLAKEFEEKEANIRKEYESKN